MDESESESESPTPPTTPPFTDVQTWSHQGLLVTVEGPGWANDSENDYHDPPPQVPDWTEYPVRLRVLVNDLATEWWLVSLDCVMLVAKRTITGHYSLDRLASGYLLTEGETNDLIECVLAERREYTQLRPHMIPGYRRLSRPIRVPAPLSEHDTPFRDMIANTLPRSAYSFLVQTRGTVQRFIHSLPPDAFPWLFSPDAEDRTTFDLHTTWNLDTGYPFWHAISPYGEVLWFRNRTTRDFIIQTLIDGDSNFCLGNTNFFFPSLLELRPVENVGTECQKISFVLAWLIVELRDLRDFLPGQTAPCDDLISSHIRKVAREQTVIYEYLDSIFDMENDMKRDLMGWVTFPGGSGS